MKKAKQPGENISLKTRKTENTSVMAWINAQTNLMDSIRYLIENEVHQNGVRNLQTCIPAERGTLVGEGDAAPASEAADSSSSTDAVNSAAATSTIAAGASEAAASSEAASAAPAPSEPEASDSTNAPSFSTPNEPDSTPPDDIDDDDIASWT
ncbi:hypothetical protein [Cohnella nanjingensis]|uniref:hypothetical protein n=1 Tax=Cohnella nanjingensis TaxID=1387779 RepID=UPI001C87CA70|nr:hypothetical protein [Cohnella nanjingensis]